MLRQRTTPPRYSSRDCLRPPCPDGRPHNGCGMVIFFRSSLRITEIAIYAPLTTCTFEVLCLSIEIPRGWTTLIAIEFYRPGSTSPTGQFFDELSSVLEGFVTCNNQLGVSVSPHSQRLHYSHALPFSKPRLYWPPFCWRCPSVCSYASFCSTSQIDTLSQDLHIYIWMSSDRLSLNF